MPRKKVKDRSKLLSHLIGVKVTEAFYKKLKGIEENSNCGSIGEVARKILLRERILFYQRDKDLDETMQELNCICKELRAIGVNINQITRHFNATKKTLHSLKADQYRKVGVKVPSEHWFLAIAPSK